MRSNVILTRFYSFLKILDLICHVGQHLLLREKIIDTNDSVDFFRESISEVLCKYVLIWCVTPQNFRPYMVGHDLMFA